MLIDFIVGRWPKFSVGVIEYEMALIEAAIAH
jgi:hypothetical protein